MDRPHRHHRISKEERQAKGRNRHAPHQTAALNEVFARTDHPSLQERISLADRLGMETKVVNSWFQNKRASLRKRAERIERSSRASTGTPAPTPEEPQPEPRLSLPSISALLAARPASRPPPIDDGSEYASDDDSSMVVLPPVMPNPPRTAAPYYPHTLCKPRLPELDIPQPRSAFAVSQQIRLPAPHSPSRLHVHNAAAPRPPLLDMHRFNELYNLSDDDGDSTHSSNGPLSTLVTSHAFFPPLVEGSRLTDMYKKPTGDEQELRRSVSGPLPSLRTSFSRRGPEGARFPSPSASSGPGAMVRPSTFDPDEQSDFVQIGAKFPEPIAYKIRKRPGQDQLAALRKLWEETRHPSKETRATLAEEIGMRYQTVTNWFQNQRSLLKRKQREGMGDSDSRERSATPETYTETEWLARPRRTRPEPYQLKALKELYARTQMPSIEQRNELALQIGMDYSRITNWFRNLRQTAKKKAMDTGAVESGTGTEDVDVDYDVDAEDEGWSTNGGYSRAMSVSTLAGEATPESTHLTVDITSPIVRRPGDAPHPSPEDVRSPEEPLAMPEDINMDMDDSHDVATDEDEQQEAVTPGGSPHPLSNVEIRASTSSVSPAMDSRPDGGHQAPPSPAVERYKNLRAESEKPSGARVEDAVLLLSLRQSF